MITPVTDECLNALLSAHRDDRASGGLQADINWVIAELRALRLVADAAETVYFMFKTDRVPSLRAALRDAGRLP